MAKEPSTAELERIRGRLAHYRDQPADTSGVPEVDLGSFFKFLVQPNNPGNAPLHWFCSKADSLVFEAAAFMIRLHAYNGGRVADWRKQLHKCLLGCSECARGLQESRVNTRHTYFGAFTDNVIQMFYKSFDDVTAQFILDTCKQSGILPDAPSADGKTLANIPPSIVYLMLSNMSITRNPKIMSILRSHAPPAPIKGWSSNSLPAGIFLLLMDKSPKLRAWAIPQVALCIRRPMPSEHFTTAHADILRACTEAIPASDTIPDSDLFSDDLFELWQGYSTLLRFVPNEWLSPSDLSRIDVRQTVIGHLSDTGKHFSEVLKAFLVILDRSQATTWKGDSDEFPQVVFNTIKDNPSYADMLQLLSAEKGRWAIQWMEAYVKTIADLPAFGTTMPLIIQYLCEELQHERYKDCRSSAIRVASRLLHSVLFDSKSKEDGTSQSLISVWESMDIHAPTFVSVAFGRGYTDAVWNDAREPARDLIKAALNHDVTNIHLTIVNLANGYKSKSASAITALPAMRTQLWKKTYESILPSDSYSIATVLHILSNISHVDDLTERAFESRFVDREDIQKVRDVVRSVNTALNTLRTGFEDAVSRYLDFADSGAVLELLSQPDVAKKIMIMMCSPLNSIRQPVQSLAGLAMDVESRPDCFRALLLNFPSASLGGMVAFLETFIRYTPRVPEACSLSKALALCFTDIIDVLCSNPGGLLHKTNFLQAIGEPGPSVQLPNWWDLMSQALSIIFRHSVGWAVFFENNEMVIWMRDALIFGRDMLAQWRVIESGALALSPQSSKNQSISRIGSKMIGKLQGVLAQLIKWLKLTDEELLYQAFSLLQSLLGCFRETGVDPSSEVMAALERYATPGSQRTRLDNSRINALRETLDSFAAEESDDEVEIIEHVIKEPTKAVKKPKPDQFEARAKPKAPPVQQKLVPTVKKPKLTDRKDEPQKLGREFTTQEQRKLEKASVAPKFTRTTTASSASSSSKPPLAEPPKATLNRTPATSSAASDSSSDEGTAFAELIKKPPPQRKEPRRVIMMDGPLPARVRMLRRNDGMDESRRNTLRLKPDISSLHRRILSWNYDHEGPYPPGENLKPLRVVDKFEDIRQYHNTFEPLLLLECWAQIQQSKEAGEEKFTCSIVGRQYADNWIDMEITMTEGVSKDWSLSETDIVLLRHPTNKQSHLMKVQHYSSNHAGLTGTLRMLANPSNPGPQAQTTWHLSKVFSLTTLHREYSALVALPYYDMVQTIMKPSLPQTVVPNQSEQQKLMQDFKLNEPQSKAILSALQTNGFSLIQGPPGTGKTSTICGLVHSFISKRRAPATFINVGQDSGPAQKEISKKILLCAPSNAAIDEITYRLKDATNGPGQQGTALKVVRIGNPKSMNASVTDVALDYLTEKKLNASADAKSAAQDTGSKMSLVRAELESVKRLRQEKEEEAHTIRDNSAKTLALDNEIGGLRQKIRHLTSQLDNLRDQQKGNRRTMDGLSRRYRAEVLQEADVICATLAGSGHELLEPFEFEMVVIDEAAQAVELSSLIPLKYRCNRCVMVGDPQQLPPTVISQEASKYGYNQSLFVRLQKHRPEAVHLLSIQYRMHPEISILPSRLFYNGRLLDGPSMSTKTQKPWHTSPKFGPYRFYNVSRGVEESGRFHSLINRTESQIAVALFNRLRQEFANVDLAFKVGVVTMYRAQVGELRRAFEQRFGAAIAGTVDFNTVDGFQGQEKDVIILSCVRAGPGLSNVGFLADVRRMNVALTRAKSSVFILGNAATLERSDENWKAIVQDARQRSCFVDTDVSFFTSPGGGGPQPRQPANKPAPKPPSQAQAAAPPAGLVALGRKASTKTPKPPSAAPTVTPSSVSTPQESSSTVGQKRPAPASPPPPPSSKQPWPDHPGLPNRPNNPGRPDRPQQTNDRAEGGDRPPRPPKQKRPKNLVVKPKGPPRLFIERKDGPSYKRPAPEGGEAGPSANRRKI